MLNKEILQQEFDSGLWHKDIAEKYHVGVRTIYQRVKDWEIKVERKNKKKDIEWKTCSVCGKQFKQLKSTTCNSCLQNSNNLQTDSLIEDTKSDLGQKIVKLRKEGQSMEKIAQQLNCSKSTVSYHCKSNTREKIKNKNQENVWLCSFLKQLHRFKKMRKYSLKNMEDDWNKKLRSSTSHFQRTSIHMAKFSYHDALKHIGGLKCTCYLTGRNIDITVDDYHFDHIVPLSKGGTCELSNLGVTCPEANLSKTNLTVDEYLALCKEVLEHNGYTVIKN